ncbi:MAG: DUF4105 domain-containing protein [Oligoflexus sp.]|nr:DUF4105 domain-containing protein [Oligoflexus sp.]
MLMRMMLNRALFLTGLVSGLLLSPIARAASAGDGQWLRLMHYQRGIGAALTSSIDSPNFFISPQGRSDPEAEWTANLALLKETSWTFQGEAVDPQCVFPARALYFQSMGLLSRDHRSCPELETFQKQLDLDSMSLVFSTAYAGNSASMFGHTLLKLNRKNSDPGRGLLDYGVAFLALSDPTDGALYALKGLLGGYPGFYTIQNYYELVNQYAYSENRDLWELPIALDESEKRYLVTHLWELNKGVSASYYFTHVNCASMLAELIDVAKTDWQIRASIKGFVMPSELIRRVSDRTGPREMGFRASQRRRWLHNLTRLESEELSVYRKNWDEQKLSSNVEAGPDAQVLDTLLDRITIEKGRLNFELQKPLRRFERDVLMARSSIATASSTPNLRGENNPVLAHGPKRVEVHAGAYDKEFLYGIRLRAGWHDLLDSSEGFEPYYHLNYFNLTLDRLRSGKTLHAANFKLAEVWSLNPYTVDEHILSWMMGGGADYREGQRSIYFKGAGGISATGGIFLFSFLPGAELRVNLTRGRMEADMFVHFQVLARWTKLFRSLAVVEPGIDDRKNQSMLLSLENRFDFSKFYQGVFKVERESWKYEIEKELKTGASRWELGFAKLY